MAQVEFGDETHVLSKMRAEDLQALHDALLADAPNGERAGDLRAVAMEIEDRAPPRSSPLPEAMA